MADHLSTQPQQDRSGHFRELMESPCTNHNYPVKHLYKDYELLKCLLRQEGGTKEEKDAEAAAEKGGVVGKDLDD